MADGSIIIDTRIDTGGVSKGMNAVKAGITRISAQVSKMGDSAKSSFQRQITAITDLYQNYEKQERKVSELKSKLEELSKVRIETEEYKKLKDDIKALEDEFEKVETKQREWLDMGFSIDSAPLQELDKQMDDIWADIDRLQRKQKKMQETGRAYVDPTSTDAYKGTAERYNTESQKLERINGRLYSSYNNLKNKVEEYRQKNNRLAQAMQNLQKAAARVGMVVKNMGSALRSAGSSIKSRLAYKSVGITDKTTAAGSQLDDLALVEHLITHTLRTGMAAGNNYKDIYQDCKNRLEAMRYLQCTA